MKNEKAHRLRARYSLEAIEECAASCRKDWKGLTPPTLTEIETAINKLSYFVGRLKDYRSIRIQMMKEAEK